MTSACVACGGSQDAAVDTSNLPRIGVEYRLTEDDICLGKGSPAIALSDLWAEHSGEPRHYPARG